MASKNGKFALPQLRVRTTAQSPDRTAQMDRLFDDFFESLMVRSLGIAPFSEEFGFSLLA